MKLVFASKVRCSFQVSGLVLNLDLARDGLSSNARLKSSVDAT
jgi:hypothetical protein